VLTKLTVPQFHVLGVHRSYAPITPERRSTRRRH
jgi:hypothetical protein